MTHKRIYKIITPIILAMMLLAFIPNKAYCVDLIKGEWYSIPLQDGTRGKYIYYGSGNGGIFFLDQEAYNAATKVGLPVIPFKK